MARRASCWPQVILKNNKTAMPGEVKRKKKLWWGKPGRSKETTKGIKKWEVQNWKARGCGEKGWGQHKVHK